MYDFTIRTMDVGELRLFYKYIKQDFPVGEYPPYDILFKQLQDHHQEGLVLCLGEQDLAYAICAAGTDYVLLSLMAVFPEYRGQGVGSAFLQALQSRYARKQAMIGEVERLELANNPNERKLRNDRIKFYKKAGFYLIPEVDYTIWDVPMNLMAFPIRASQEDINDDIQIIMYQIYLKLMGKQFMHKMSI